MDVTFEHIYTDASLAYETNLFCHYEFLEVLEMYDSNFIRFKKMPKLKQLIEAENYIKEVHAKRGQKHVKFVFPQDLVLREDIESYLQTQGYEINGLQLYIIEPAQFKQSSSFNGTVAFVTQQTLAEFCEFHYSDALKFGEAYATQKSEKLKKDFELNRKYQIIAKLTDGTVVGAVEIIKSENYAEIDSLFVLQEYQKQGIGTAIQQFVMNEFKDKQIILVTESDNTARHMYVKQGYIHKGFQQNALKNDFTI